jgi:hypothetical protein
MSQIDVEPLIKDMLAAMEGAVKLHWNDIKPFAQTEAEKLAATAVQIKLGQANGSINPAQAKILLRMQANASQAVLTAVETASMITAQDAINGALNVLTAAVNKAIGSAFL